MAYKEFTLDDNLTVKIYKRRSARNLRLSVDPKGGVKVSIPTWAPYKTGLEFARSRASWIRQNARVAPVLSHNQAIGKAHRLQFKIDSSKAKPTSRISDNAVTISFPPHIDETDLSVQSLAQKAGLKALRLQAESLLPQRLKVLADKFGFSYNEVSVKDLKSRWGSCDQSKNIVLSLYLMQLPWDLIDYVLLHELTHTEVLRHGPDFWNYMEKILPGTKQLKKRLKAYQPIIDSPSKTFMA